jgi:Zn-dependent protease with chaperone function
VTAIVATLGMALLLLPGVTRLRAERLHPAEWTRAATLALRAGHRSLQVALALGAAPTVLHTVGIEHAATVCHDMFGPVAPGGPIAGWVAAALLTWTIVAARRARRQLRAGFEQVRVHAWLGHHEALDGIDLATVAVPAPLAYALPSRDGGQIVLSQLLRSQLNPNELDAVLAHERSHLRHHHHLILETLAALDAAYRWMPAIGRSTARVRVGLERWADEDAALIPAGRTHVRSALAKTGELLLAPGLAFTGCAIVDRICALEQAAPNPSYRARILTLAPLALTGAAVAAITSGWIVFTHHGIAGVLGFCPI